MITLFIFIILINSLYTVGLSNASKFEYKSEDHPELGVVEESKMILWKVRYLSQKYLGEYWSKPIITCPPCMASIHSTYVFWPVALYLYDFHPLMILAYPLYVGALSGVNYVFVSVMDLVKAVTDKYNYQ